jgi:CRP-like cAMP-binding protein
LSDEELVAVFSSLERSHFTTGATVKAPDEEEKDLFMVVFGTLRESAGQPADTMEKLKKSLAVLLGGEDCFGDVYPFSVTRTSRSCIEAMSRVELIRLPKDRLQSLCRQHRNIEIGLVELCKVRSESGAEGLSQMIRECGRYENLVGVSLEVYPTATQGHPLTVEAYAQGGHTPRARSQGRRSSHSDFFLPQNAAEYQGPGRTAG